MPKASRFLPNPFAFPMPRTQKNSNRTSCTEARYLRQGERSRVNAKISRNLKRLRIIRFSRRIQRNQSRDQDGHIKQSGHRFQCGKHPCDPRNGSDITIAYRAECDEAEVEGVKTSHRLSHSTGERESVWYNFVHEPIRYRPD